MVKLASTETPSAKAQFCDIFQFYATDTMQSLQKGRMNWRIRFLKISRLFEIRIGETHLFHSITEDGKKVFLKKLYLK